MKNYPGIIVRQRNTDRKQNGTAVRAVRRVKEGTFAVLLQPGLNENWWADTMECYCICERIKISCLMGRHHMRGGSGYHFDGPVIPFGALVEYHPISAKDLSRLHQLGPKVLPDIYLGCARNAG